MNIAFSKVQEVLENYKSAVCEKDVERFISSYTHNVHVYDCWGEWEYVGITQWGEMVKEWFDGLNDEGVFLKTDFNDLIVVENGDLAFAYCNVTYVAHNESGKKLRQMTNRFTFGLKKEIDSWKISHEHSSLPINMDTGKGLFNLK